MNNSDLRVIHPTGLCSTEGVGSDKEEEVGPQIYLTVPVTGVAGWEWGRAEPASVGSDQSICEVRLPIYTISCMSAPMDDPKPLRFCGSALSDLRAFPETARKEAGHQLDQVQQGREPDDWKPMKAVGPGVREIRVRDAAGAFRVIYVAQFEEAVYVLHCFGKKTRKTAKADLDLATRRLKALMRERDG